MDIGFILSKCAAVSYDLCGTEVFILKMNDGAWLILCDEDEPTWLIGEDDPAEFARAYAYPPNRWGYFKPDGALETAAERYAK